MRSWLLFLFFSTTCFCIEKEAVSEKALKIFELLPFVVHPPLVEPHLPQQFLLGSQNGDPYFSQGYYWGSQNSLDEYFAHQDKLSGCLIRAQISSSVFQSGVDKFSFDRNPNDLAAAGFTEVRMNRGKWGIFPYREVQAKGPKGRRHHQLWVGLNSTEGTTIYFQLIYPTFLNEPTQSQKKIWKDFVMKTGLLNHDDLVLAHGLKQKRRQAERSLTADSISFSVEKRKRDHKFLVRVDSQDERVHVQSVKECMSVADALRSVSVVEIEAIISKNEEQEVRITHIPCSVVDEFSFGTDLLMVNHLEECGQALLVY